MEKEFRVQKRDGKLQAFNSKKITKAVFLAYNHIHPKDIPCIDDIVSRIISELAKKSFKNKVMNIEAIQDTVEAVLMITDELVARHYILYRQERADLRKTRKSPDPLAIAGYIHESKYSRWDPGSGRRELFSETVERVMRMHMRKYPDLHNEIREAFKWVKQKKILPSMRSMQFAGVAIEKHNARMYNCSFTLIDRPEVFGHILYLLLCGCGVGFSVQWKDIEKLPKLNFISSRVQHYTIEDSIEGWANALTELFHSFISGNYIEFNYSAIRAEGAYLETSGGQAPGHLPLKKALDKIRKILMKAQGRKLRPIECHDMICFSAEAVLAGGIRRSSLISLFSPEDTEMLYAKSRGSYDPLTGINVQRAMANNSAVLNRRHTTEETFNRIIGIAEESWGDPGFFFSDDYRFGCNPCGEIGINPVFFDEGKYSTGFGFCNLCEINMAAISDEEEFYQAAEAATFIGTLQAGYTDFPFLGSITEGVARHDALLGVSMTGMMDNPELAFNTNYQSECARRIKKKNADIAKKIGIQPAERCTTIKPGGTAPLELGGVACGIHPHHSRRYFRRVTANRSEPAFLHFRKTNPHMIEEKPNGDFCIVFPMEVSSNALTVKEMPAIKFMDLIFSTYDHWILGGMRNINRTHTHNVSATVMIDPDEKEDVMAMVWSNKHRIGAMSFAPKMLDKKFPFAPREEVTPAEESRWNYLIENYRPVDWTKMTEGDIKILKADCECSGQKECSIV